MPDKDRKENDSGRNERGLHQPDFVARVEAQGTEIIGSTPDELTRVVKAELGTWRKVVANAGVRP